MLLKFWKEHKIISIFIILLIIYGLIYVFVPVWGNPSRFQQWINRNEPLRGVAGAPPEYGGNSDYPNNPKNPIPVK